MRRFKRYGRWAQRDPKWPAVRLRALRRDGWRCVQCGARGKVEVDHIKPVRERPDLAFDESNLQTLCKTHHSLKTRAELGMGEPNPEREKWRDLLRNGLPPLD